METFHIFDVVIKDRGRTRNGDVNQWPIFHDIINKGITVKRVNKNKTINGKNKNEVISWANIDAGFPPIWNFDVFRIFFPKTPDGESLISYFFLTLGAQVAILDTNYSKKKLESINVQ